jgi:hypothetical protein
MLPANCSRVGRASVCVTPDVPVQGPTPCPTRRRRAELKQCLFTNHALRLRSADKVGLKSKSVFVLGQTTRLPKIRRAFIFASTYIQSLALSKFVNLCKFVELHSRYRTARQNCLDELEFFAVQRSASFFACNLILPRKQLRTTCRDEYFYSLFTVRLRLGNDAEKY